MQAILNFFVQWTGVLLCLLVAVVALMTSLPSGVTKAEKTMEKDETHYLMRYGAGRLGAGLLLLVVAMALSWFIGWLTGGGAKSDTRTVVAILAQVLIALVAGFIFSAMQRSYLCERVCVDGDRIVAYPCFGKPIQTSFDQIRTVKKVDGDTPQTSAALVLRPNGNKRFRVTRQMSNYERFAAQVDSLVALPNLTKKQEMAE